MKEQDIKKAVREGYAQVAKQASSCCCSSNCCGTAKPNDISKKIGYTDDEMEAVPSGSNLGLGCGNPIALASIKEGETILDLGSGAGFDCFLASNKVGPEGKVIGVDMTGEMVAKARDNALKGGYKNVEFRLGEIEKLPVEDNTIDLVISNCVINLVPDKEKAFKEAFRVLRPGGRLMVSDIVLTKELPDFVKESIKAYISCVSGAMMKSSYLDAIRLAGFKEVAVVDESVSTLDCVGDDPFAKHLNEIEGSASSIKVRGFKPT
jgi:arsenite methyltransferase